jgi:2',3'-cyclic-nucleotide 2'-phosphodiesterase/3'-nucleotidase
MISTGGSVLALRWSRASRAPGAWRRGGGGDVLEHAARGWLALERGGEAGGALRREPGLPAYSYDTLEGATYFVGPTAPVGARIRGLRVAGRPVKPDEEFALAISSYRGAGGGRYPHLASAPRVREIDRPMVEYFAAHPRLTPVATENWSFTVPLRDAGAGAATLH